MKEANLSDTAPVSNNIVFLVLAYKLGLHLHCVVNTDVNAFKTSMNVNGMHFIIM